MTWKRRCIPGNCSGEIEITATEPCEFDDVFSNTLGGLIGFALAMLVEKTNKIDLHRICERVSAKALQDLPSEYKEIARTQQIDIKIKNGLSVILCIALIGIGCLVEPIDVLAIFNPETSLSFTFFWIKVIGLVVVYSFFHESIHYWLMKAYGGKKVGWSCNYLKLSVSVKSEDYYKRTPFIIITMAPVIILGIVIFILTAVFPKWFWYIWMLQTSNISGAAGDFNVLRILIRKPESALVLDSGMSITVYNSI